MRVVIIAPFYRPSVGGVEYIAYRTARGLVGRGFWGSCCVYGVW